jgi:hypothetical protein
MHRSLLRQSSVGYGAPGAAYDGWLLIDNGWSGGRFVKLSIRQIKICVWNSTALSGRVENDRQMLTVRGAIRKQARRRKPEGAPERDLIARTVLHSKMQSMPFTLDPPALTAGRLQEAVRIRRRIDQLERRLRALFSARRESKRNSYGFSGAEMSKIGTNLHVRAKERITNGRSRAFTVSIEEIL